VPLSEFQLLQENTLQAVLATDGNTTYVLFIYDDIQWGNNKNVIGFNAGDLMRSYTLPESQTARTILNLENSSNVGIPGVYVFRVDQESSITAPTCMLSCSK
jgi:hypothetical protein